LEEKERARSGEKPSRRKRFRRLIQKDFSRHLQPKLRLKRIRAAFDHPRQVNADLVMRSKRGRVLDRIVGYKISPLLWEKCAADFRRRVQTVALGLIVEREQEIRAFIPQEYWSIHAMLDAGRAAAVRSEAFEYKGETLEIHNQEARTLSWQR